MSGAVHLTCCGVIKYPSISFTKRKVYTDAMSQQPDKTKILTFRVSFRSSLRKPPIRLLLLLFVGSGQILFCSAEKNRFFQAELFENHRRSNSNYRDCTGVYLVLDCRACQADASAKRRFSMNSFPISCYGVLHELFRGHACFPYHVRRQNKSPTTT